ncbi:DMT family transporter [Actibacterium sp. 188UL27-1]|nr:DMT family transporter [Actibacterium sp. 188UL27-1]
MAAILASVCALSLGDALIKGTGLSLPLWQMFILRSALTIPLLWWLARRRGMVRLTAPGWVVLRSALLVAMWLSYYAALSRMPLPVAAAAYYTGPVFIVVLSALVARQWPPMLALAASASGFIGVVLIIRPDASGFDAHTLLPVLAAMLYASAMVLTSAKCRGEDPFSLALALNVAFILGGAALASVAGRDGSVLLGPWQSVDPGLIATVAALAVLLLIGSVGAAVAYQNGPPATIAAFDYAYLGFSLAWGRLFFAEIPDVTALIGMGLIAAAGLVAVFPPRSSERRD